MRSSGSVEGRPVGRAQAPDADQRDCDKDIDPAKQMAPPTVCGPIIARLRRSQPMGHGITLGGGAQRGHCRTRPDEPFAGSLATRPTSRCGKPTTISG
jgi:hypothetical protein